jgi:tetratricopeptide (TPR) repeat protein
VEHAKSFVVVAPDDSTLTAEVPIRLGPIDSPRIVEAIVRPDSCGVIRVAMLPRTLDGPIDRGALSSSAGWLDEESGSRWRRWAQLRARARRPPANTERTTLPQLWLDTAEAALAAGLEPAATQALSSAAFYRLLDGDLAAAERLLKRARRLYLVHPTLGGEFTVAFYQAMLARAYGRYRLALRSAEQALLLARRLRSTRFEIDSVNQLSILLLELGRISESLDAIHGVELPDSVVAHSTVPFLINRAFIQLEAAITGGRPLLESALEDLDRAVEALAKTHDPMRKRRLAITRAEILVEMGRYDEAVATARQVDFDRLSAAYQPYYHAILGRALAGAGSTNQAHAALERAYTDVTVSFSRTAMQYGAMAKGRLAELSLATGSREAALKHIRPALRLAWEASEVLYSHRTEHTFQSRYRRLLDMAVRVFVAAGRPREALDEIERWRGASTRRMRTLAQNEGDGTETELAARIETFAQLRSDYETVRRNRFQSSREERQALEERLKDMAVQLRSEYEAIREIRRRSTPEDREPLSARWSGRKALLVSRYVLPDRMLHFVLTRDSVEVSETTPDLQARLEESPVPVVLLEPWEDLDLEPLLKRTTISRLPVAWGMPSEGSTSGRPRVVIGDPNLDLPMARREAKEVARRLGAERMLLGDQATRENVMDAMSTASIVHFSGHGLSSQRRPWDSHLVLASRQRLTIEDLFVAQPAADLVVLSGCETGADAPLSDLEPLSLPTAFMLGGTRAVLATLHAVDDDEARRFIELFYEHGGADRPAEAYRRAALAQIEAAQTSWRSFAVWSLPPG